MCGWVLHKMVLKKVPDTFRLAEKLQKVSFPAQTCGTKKATVHRVSRRDGSWVESVPKTISRFAPEQRFDWSLRKAWRCRRPRGAWCWRAGWVEWDDMINYITKKLSGIINCQIEAVTTGNTGGVMWPAKCFHQIHGQQLDLRTHCRLPLWSFALGSPWRKLVKNKRALTLSSGSRCQQRGRPTRRLKQEQNTLSLSRAVCYSQLMMQQNLKFFEQYPLQSHEAFINLILYSPKLIRHTPKLKN